MASSRKDVKRDRPSRLGDVEGFVQMMLGACRDPAMKAQLEAIVNLSPGNREVGLRRLLDDLRERRAPAHLLDAMTCLLDDEISQKVKEALHRCS